MILAVDIGNTNIKIAAFKDDKLIKSFRLSATVNKTSDEYGFDLKNILQQGNISPDSFSGAIMSSVNPNLNYTIEHMIEYYFNVSPLIVGSGIKTGLNIKYDNPKEVGSDRIMGSLAAYYLYGGPCIVIDFGTATTFNAISEKGEFLGGAITVGIKAASDALSRSGARLPRVELTKPTNVINKTTITNMQSGLLNGFIGSTEYITNKIKEEMGGNSKVIATGGLSEMVKPYTDIIDIVDRTLTLKGLHIVYKLNTTGK